MAKSKGRKRAGRDRHEKALSLTVFTGDTLKIPSVAGNWRVLSARASGGRCGVIRQTARSASAKDKPGEKFVRG